MHESYGLDTGGDVVKKLLREEAQERPREETERLIIAAGAPGFLEGGQAHPWAHAPGR